MCFRGVGEFSTPTGWLDKPLIAGRSCTASLLGLQINWTKIQQVGEPRLTRSTVQVAATNVVFVDEFIYLGSLTLHDGGCEAEISRRTGIATECFCLQKNIWRSHIYTNTKVRLYRTYILAVLLCGCETWTDTKTLPNASMPSTPDVCIKLYEYHTPDILQMRQFGASQAARQSLKG